MQVRAWLATVVLLIAGVPSTLFAQSDELHTLNHQVKQLYEAGKYSEAIPLAEKSLELTRAQEGEDSPQTAVRTSWLATLYQEQGRYADAEPLFKRALAIREKALGPDHPDVAQSLNNLAVLYQQPRPLPRGRAAL